MSSNSSHDRSVTVSYPAERWSGEAPAALPDSDALRRTGRALEAGILKKASQWLGRDLSGVRVHHGPGADAMARMIGASAFTVGADIFFARGEYDPHTDRGSELIAHELVHVVQQSGFHGTAWFGDAVVHPADDALEQEAEALASQAVADWSQSRSKPQRVRLRTSQPGTIQRRLRDTCMTAPPKIISCHATTTWWLYQEAHGAGADWSTFLGGAHMVCDYLSQLIQEYGKKRTQWFTTGTIKVDLGSVLVFTSGKLSVDLPSGHSCVCGNDGQMHGSSQGGCFSDCGHGKVGMCHHAPSKIAWSKGSMSKANDLYVYTVSEADAERWARRNL